MPATVRKYMLHVRSDLFPAVGTRIPSRWESYSRPLGIAVFVYERQEVCGEGWDCLWKVSSSVRGTSPVSYRFSLLKALFLNGVVLKKTG